ncbi:MAG: hypothetical protein LUG45_05400 [Clostridiales bacterium]|nr:hypothetical protein [Clostridiales bacterium]
MATKEELWNEVEELALKHAAEILKASGEMTKENVDKADRLVYIATSVEANRVRQKANGL